MNYNAKTNITYYIISGPESEESIQAFKAILNLACQKSPESVSDCPLLQHPLEAHVILSKILFESSHGYINAFRQSMFTQVRWLLPPEIFTALIQHALPPASSSR